MNRANASVTVVYTYTSSTAAVATVSAAGMVTAVAPGTTTITVSAAGTGTGFAAATMTSAATITVSDRAPGLTSLQVSPASAALTVGGTQSVTASAQGPRAAAATMTYGTSAPAIATVSATGVITAVAAGTATITVTAQSTQDGAFAASSLTGLVTVTVSNPAVVSINISALTQGPTTTSYVVGTTGATGIVSAANGQVGQAIDINNTRDQIQMTATLATNGASVDSVVAYVANADGTNRTSVGRQSYPSAAASGPVSLYINTADFTADFTAGTAAAKFANGQKQISVSAFSGATELKSTNSQTVNFNNVDGYASQLAAPARSVTTATGVIWHGGGDSTTANMGRAVIVPVFYTPARVPASLTLAMRQTSATATIAACGSSARNNLLSAPYVARFGSTKAATQASATATAAIGDSTVLNCGGLESADAHVIGVTGGIDNSGTALPLVTYAGGFRTSATVTAPTALKLDYNAPTATPINKTRTLPAVTGWVNASYNFTTETAATTDAGVGIADLGTVVGKGGRTWSYYGCTTILSTAPTGFTGLAGDIPACATNLTATAYTVQYSQEDRLENRSALVNTTVGVDVLAPAVTWNNVPTDSVQKGNFAAVTYVASVTDYGSSGIADSGAVKGYVARQALNDGTDVYYSNTVAPNQRRCFDLNAANALVASSRTGTDAALTTYSQASPTLTCNSSVPPTLLQPADVNGLRILPLSFSTATGGSMQVAVQVTDRAGNSSAVATRRAMHDATAPVFTITTPANGVNSTALPVFPITYVDRKIKNTYLELRYNSVAYRYPAKSLGNGAFGDFGTPNEGNVGTTPTAATPTASTLTVPYTGTFVTAVQSGAAAGTVTVIGDAYAKGMDEAGNGGTTASPFAVIVTPPAVLTATSGTFVVLSALTQAGGAEAGLKAQLTGAATTTTNPYSRVDFYRQAASGARQYLGSSGTPTASLTGTPATTPVFTWKIDSYATDSVGLAQAPASTADVIMAMGVRNTGAADLTGTSVIGGSAIKVTFAGLPAGVSGTATLSGSNGFVQSITSPNGSVTVPVTNGVYTLSYGGSVTSNIGEVFAVTNSPLFQIFTVVGDAGIQTATDITYALTAANRIALTIGGLPTDLTPVTVTLSKVGSPSSTVVGYNGVNTFSVPSAGTYTISTPRDVFVGAANSVGRAALALQSTATASTLTVTVTNAASLANSVVVGDQIVTAANAVVGTVSAVTTSTLTLAASGPTISSAAPLFISRRTLESTHTFATTAATVTAGGSSFGPVNAGDVLELPSGFVVGTVASKASTTVLTLASLATIANTVSSGTTSNQALHHVLAPTATAVVTTGSTANAATAAFLYNNVTAGQSAYALTAVKSNAASGVTLTPSISTGLSSPSTTTIAHGSVAGGATTADKATTMPAQSNTFTVTAALGSDGVTYGNTATATVVSAVGGGTRVVLEYWGAKLAVKFAGANVADLAGYTVPISYVGPQGTLAAVTRNIATTASGSGTAVLVPIAGTYTVAPITAMTLGNYTYTFTVGTVSAVYQSAATEIIVNVTRTVLPPALGVTAVAASSVLAWDDVDNAATRTITPTLAAGAAFVSTPTCVARTATAGGGNVSSTITTLVNAVTGVCTLTGAGVGGFNVFITWTGTAAGAGLSLTTETREFTILRTTPAATLGFTVAGSATTTVGTLQATWLNAEATARIIAPVLASGATVTSVSCVITYASGGVANLIVATTVDATTGACTLNLGTGNAGASPGTLYTVTYSVTVGGTTGLSTVTLGAAYTITRQSV